MNCLLIICTFVVLLVVLQTGHAEEEEASNELIYENRSSEDEHTGNEKSDDDEISYDVNRFENGGQVPDYDDNASHDKIDLKLLNILKKVPQTDLNNMISDNPHFLHSPIFKDLNRRFVAQYPYVEMESEEDEEKLRNILQAIKNVKSHQNSNLKKKKRKRNRDLIPVKAPRDLVLAIAKESKLLEDSKPVNPTEELIQREILRTGDYWDGVWKEDQYPETLLRTDGIRQLDLSKKRKISVDSDLIPIKAPRDLVLKIAKESKLLEDSKPVNPTEELIQKEILRSGNYWDGVWKEDADPKTLLRTQKRYEKSLNLPKHSRAPKLEFITAKIMPGTKLHKLVSVLKPISPQLLYIVNNKVKET